LARGASFALTASLTKATKSAVFAFFSSSFSPMLVICSSKMTAIFRSAASRFTSAGVTSCGFVPDHLALAARDADARLCSGDIFAALLFPPIFPPLLPISAITDLAPLLDVPVAIATTRLAD
jgi:hypothetical protein